MQSITESNHGYLLESEEGATGIRRMLEGYLSKGRNDTVSAGYRIMEAACANAADRDRLIAFLSTETERELVRVFGGDGDWTAEALMKKWNNAWPDQGIEATESLLRLSGSLPPNPNIWNILRDMWVQKKVPHMFPLSTALFCALSGQQFGTEMEPHWQKMLEAGRDHSKWSTLYPPGNVFDGADAIGMMARNAKIEGAVPSPMLAKSHHALVQYLIPHVIALETALSETELSDGEIRREVATCVRRMYLNLNEPCTQTQLDILNPELLRQNILPSQLTLKDVD